MSSPLPPMNGHSRGFCAGHRELHGGGEDERLGGGTGTKDPPPTPHSGAYTLRVVSDSAPRTRVSAGSSMLRDHAVLVDPGPPPATAPRMLMASGARAWGERAGASLALSHPASPGSFAHSSVWKRTPLSLGTQYREKVDLSLEPGDFGTDVPMLWEACWLSRGPRGMGGQSPPTRTVQIARSHHGRYW